MLNKTYFVRVQLHCATVLSIHLSIYYFTGLNKSRDYLDNKMVVGVMILNL